jgi:hypothetical protein
VADQSIEFDLELNDEMTKYLREGDAAVMKMTADMLLLRNQAKLAGGSLEDFTIPLQKIVDKLPRLEGLGDGGILKSLTGGVTGGVLFAHAIERVARSAYEGYTELQQFAVDAAEFKANTTGIYSALKGTAAEGVELFSVVDQAARRAHLPAERAHQLAQDLLENGLKDTGLIANTISAQAALIRTGQLAGAEKLHGIIEKSLASGHLEVRGLEGGKGKASSGRALAGLGVTAPELIDSLANRLHTSVANVKAELKAGQISAEVGIAAITDAINTGGIGKAAAAKFDLKDFATDFGNAMQRVAQDSNLNVLDQSLVDAGAALEHLTDQTSPLKELFQVLVDAKGGAIEKLTILSLELEGLYLDLRLATKGMGDFGGATSDTGSLVGTVVGGAFTILKDTLVEIVEYADDVGTAFEEAGAAIGYFFTAKSGDKGADTSLFDTLDKMDQELQKRQRNRGHVLDGSNAIPLGPSLGPPTPAGEPGIEAPPPSIRRPGFARGGVVGEPKSPDSVFVAARPGETILPKDFDLSSMVANIAIRSQPQQTGTKPTVYIDQILIGRDEASGEHLRPLLESAFIDALERVQLELGG